jgi:hypothetical protein
MDAYCKRTQLDKAAIEFRFNGIKMNPKLAIDKLGIKADSEIECVTKKEKESDDDEMVDHKKFHIEQEHLSQNL